MDFLSVTLSIGRVLLATIKSMSHHSCPDCLVDMSQISGMGTKLDMKRQCNKARQDGKGRQWEVALLRSWIYEYGDRVNAFKIENLLQSQSGVPNEVHLNYTPIAHIMITLA